jgi:hypothetical protein
VLSLAETNKSISEGKIERILDANVGFSSSKQSLEEAWINYKANGGDAFSFTYSSEVTDIEFMSFIKSSEGQQYVSEIGLTNQQINLMLLGEAAGVGVGLLAGRLLSGVVKSTTANPFLKSKVPKASELIKWAESQGWVPKQSPNGPLKYFDGNGINRLTIKHGSSRTPGSNFPHVEMRNSSGQRVSHYGNPTQRRGPGNQNHTPIQWDL